MGSLESMLLIHFGSYQVYVGNLYQNLSDAILKPGDALFMAWRKRPGPVTTGSVVLVGFNAYSEIFFHDGQIARNGVVSMILSGVRRVGKVKMVDQFRAAFTYRIDA